MIALILAAGYGTRLYPLAKETPKALLPVGEKPILQYLLEKVCALDSPPREILLVSNHRYAGKFQSWFQGSGLKIPWSVLDDGSTSEENRLGSMGDLAFAINSRGLKEDLLVLGSDNLFRDGLQGFAEFACRKGPTVTVGVYELENRAEASRYGVLVVDPTGRIREFKEKPPKPSSALVSTAIYFFPHPSLNWVLQYLHSQQSADTLGKFIQWLITRCPVFAYRFRGRWFDIGDIGSYTKAQESFVP